MGNAPEHLLPLHEGLGILLHAVCKRIVGHRRVRVLAVGDKAGTRVIRRGWLSIESWALAVWVGAELLAHVLAIHSKAGSLHLHQESGGVLLHAVDKRIIGHRRVWVLAVGDEAGTRVVGGCWLSIES